MTPLGPADETLLNAKKLARVHAMASALIDELHRGDLDDLSRHRLEHLTFDTLVEMGSAVPDDLLEELRRLVPPGEGLNATDAELRILWAQILGWIGGIALSEGFEQARWAVEDVLAQSEDASATAARARGPYL